MKKNNKEIEKWKKGLRVLNAKAVILGKFTGENIEGEIIEPAVSYFCKVSKSCRTWQLGWTQSIRLALHQPQEAGWEDDECNNADTESKCEFGQAQLPPAHSFTEFKNQEF